MRISINYALAAIILSLIAGAAGCAPAVQPAQSTPTPASAASALNLVAVERGDIVQEVYLYGRIAPLSQQTINFSQDGSVRNVYVRPGDYVEVGKLLADLRVDELERELELARQSLERERQAADNRTRRVEIDVEIAQLTLQQYQLEGRSGYEIRIQELKVELAQMALEEVQSDPALVPSAVRVQELEAEIESAAVFAPVSGTIISAVNPGRSVKTTTPAFIIGDVSQVEGSLEAEESVIELLVEGQPVEARLEGQSEELIGGAIRQLPYPYGSGESGADPVVRISLTVSPDEAGYALGDKIVARVVLAEAMDVLWLPPVVIRNIGGRTFVMVPEGAGLRRVEVQLGLQTQDQVEIVSGLELGQEVVVP